MTGEEETANENEVKPQRKSKSISQEEKQLRSDVQKYYAEFFDLDILWKVIDKETFSTREFGFDRMDKGFTRNISFEAPEDLKEYLSVFPAAGAYIGALYEDSVMPTIKYQKGTSIHQTKWKGRELLFDFDMDEYDQVRTCKCVGRQVCEDCWVHMQEASVIIDDTLRTDFGFTDLVWVYTGGRGYHCWVLDKQTFDLDQNQRAAIIGHMQLIHDPKGAQKIEELGPHDTFMKERILSNLAAPYIKVSTQVHLRDEAGFGPTTAKRAKDTIDDTSDARQILQLLPKPEEFFKAVIKYRYPRIDHKVSIDTKRLIRMPGSVHMNTKNVSEIIDNPAEFNPIYDATSLYDIIGTTEEE